MRATIISLSDRLTYIVKKFPLVTSGNFFKEPINRVKWTELVINLIDNKSGVSSVCLP